MTMSNKDVLADATYDAMFVMFPAWTVDHLLTHPRDAIRLCDAVRQKLGKQLNDHQILSALINMAWLGLALFAGYCIGRPYGTGPVGLAAVAAVIAANLLFSRQPGNANNDVVAIALFLSSAALGKLITLNRKLQSAGGKLVLCNIDPQIYEVFEITKLNKLFNIQKEEQAALQAF